MPRHRHRIQVCILLASINHDTVLTQPLRVNVQSLLIHSPRLPAELCETIIDCVADILDGTLSQDLTVCARVCRAWVPRVQMHLFHIIRIRLVDGNTFRNLESALRRKRYLLGYIRTLSVRGSDWEPIRNRVYVQTTNFLITRHVPSLGQCTIDHLELEKSHTFLLRFPTCAKSLRKLRLTNCETRNVLQLCRFVTSFRSLSTLVLTSDHPWSPQLPLPHLQYNRSKSSLRCLAIEATPGISLLLDHFIKASPFVAHLKHLQAYSRDPVPKDATMDPYSIDVETLDSLLTTELFPSIRVVRLVAKPPKPTRFVRLAARKVQADILDEWVYAYDTQ